MAKLHNDPRLLRGLHYFEAVARLGSVGAAAKEFGVSSGAVSHQLRDLAEIIGEQLVEKQGRGIGLTEVGRRLSARLGAAFSDINSMVSDVTGEKHISLSLGVCSCFGPSWLAPRLPDLLAKHPELDLEIRLFAQDPDQSYITADAIVTADPVKPGYASLPLFDEMLVAVCAPGQDRLEDGLRQQLITTDPKPDNLGQDWKEYCRHRGRDLDQLKNGPWIRCTHYVLALEIAKSGAGIALVPDFLALRDVSTGELAYFDPVKTPGPRSYRLCFKALRASDEAILLLGRWLKGKCLQSLGSAMVELASQK